MRCLVLTILLIIFFINPIKSQVVMNFLDSNFENTVKKNAKYIITQLNYDDSVFQILVSYPKKDSVLFTKYHLSNPGNYYNKVFYSNGLPKKAGWYINNKEEGIWLFYDDWGNLYQTRTFKKGNEKGVRKTFYMNGILKNEALITEGNINGYFKEYHKNGILSCEGNKRDSKNSGVIKEYNNHGKLTSKSFYLLGIQEGHDSIFRNDTLIKIFTYKNGKRNGPVYYFKNNSLAAIEHYKDNKINGKSIYKEAHVIDTTDHLPFLFVEEMPTFKYSKYDLADFISENLEYPEEARKAEIEGVVYLKFTVDTNGSLKDIEFISDFLGYGCDKAAYNLVLEMPDWIPGKQNGKAVPVYQILPIRFKLF